jgi:DNA-binding NarL/FixJ family response regulator
MKTDALAIIVAPPGRLRDGWQALLAAIPQIGQVRAVDDAVSTLKIVTTVSPDLVMLDAEAFGDQAGTLLAGIKEVKPQCRCIALICNISGGQQARSAGADAILIKGFSAAKLFGTVDRLLPAQRNAPDEERTTPDLISGDREPYLTKGFETATWKNGGNCA